MTHFESPLTTVDCSQEKIYNFLSDFNNFEKLIPSQLTNWKSDENNCSFSIESMADVEMKIGKKDPNRSIYFDSKEKSPFRFSIISNIESVSENTSTIQICIDADLNPFIKIIAERPLQNLTVKLAERLKEVAETSL